MRLSCINEVVKRQAISATENLEILYISPEEDWEDAAAVEQIANRVHIRISRSKDIYLVAKVGDQIIGGAAWAIIQPSDIEIYQTDLPEDYFGMDVDIVVDPDWQGYQRVGLRILEEVIKSAKQEGAGYITALVVNQRLAKIMDLKYGFEGYEGRSPVRMDKYL